LDSDAMTVANLPATHRVEVEGQIGNVAGIVKIDLYDVTVGRGDV
jgi:Ribonuclease G/E